MRVGLTEVMAVTGVAFTVWFFELHEPLSVPAKEFLAWESNQLLVDNANATFAFVKKRTDELRGGGLPACDTLANNPTPGTATPAPAPSVSSKLPDATEFKLMRGGTVRLPSTVQVSRKATEPTVKPNTKPNAIVPQPGVNCRESEAAAPGAPAETAPPGSRRLPRVGQEQREDATINRFARPEDKPYSGRRQERRADPPWVHKGCAAASIQPGERLSYEEYELHLIALRHNRKSSLANTGHPAAKCLSTDGRWIKYIPAWGDGTSGDLNELALWVSLQGEPDRTERPPLSRSRST